MAMLHAGQERLQSVGASTPPSSVAQASSPSPLHPCCHVSLQLHILATQQKKFINKHRGSNKQWLWQSIHGRGATQLCRKMASRQAVTHTHLSAPVTHPCHPSKIKYHRQEFPRRGDPFARRRQECGALETEPHGPPVHNGSLLLTRVW